MKRLIILFAVAMFALAGSAEDKFGDVTIRVVKVENGKPIRNAYVVLHPLNSDGKEQGSINLKTDSEGKTAFNNLPYGKLRIQVIAHGRKTFGQDYDFDAPEKEFEIKLQPPADQYSIYKDQTPDQSKKKD